MPFSRNVLLSLCPWLTLCLCPPLHLFSHCRQNGKEGGATLDPCSREHPRSLVHPGSQPLIHYLFITHPPTYLCMHITIHASTHPCMHTATHASTRAYMHSSIYPPIHACMYSAMHPSIHPCMHTVTHPPIHACMHSSMHPLTHACMRPPMHPPMHCSTHAWIHPFIHLPTCSFAYLFTQCSFILSSSVSFSHVLLRDVFKFSVRGHWADLSLRSLWSFNTFKVKALPCFTTHSDAGANRSSWELSSP